MLARRSCCVVREFTAVLGEIFHLLFGRECVAAEKKLKQRLLRCRSRVCLSDILPPPSDVTVTLCHNYITKQDMCQ